jgi:hypothetical protein
MAEFTTIRFGISDTGLPLEERANWLAVPKVAGDLAVAHAFRSDEITKMIHEQYQGADAALVQGITGWWLWLGGMSMLTDDPRNELKKAGQLDDGVHFSKHEDAYWRGPIGRKLLPGVRLVSPQEWQEAVVAAAKADEVEIARRLKAAADRAAAELQARRSALIKELDAAKTTAARNKILANLMIG